MTDQQQDSEVSIEKTTQWQSVPTLPLRDVVVFPHMVIPLFVGRQKSILALEAAMAGDKKLLLLTQKDAVHDDPEINELYTVGTMASILQMLKLPDGTVKVLIEGEFRVAVEKTESKDFLSSTVRVVDEKLPSGEDFQGLLMALLSQFEKLAKLSKRVPNEILKSLSGISNSARLVDTVAAHIELKIADKQEILEELNLAHRIEMLLAVIEGELDLIEVEKRIRGRVKKQMEKSQREYYLNEQMKAIQKEMGAINEGGNEFEELENKIETVGLSEEAKIKASSELKKLKMMSPMSSEASVVRGYIDCMVSLPWKKKSKLRHDIEKAKQILDDDHYGLEEVKDRILEYLAVQSRVKKLKGPVLCLVGPPGVGKTSIGKSIAAALKRKFYRFSLGGMRDEAEIKGHRKTYIGAMPGKIIQALTETGSSNPVIMLDEIDKIGSSYQGDPSSALLEVLDPEQNNQFLDHYLDVRFDLSKVLFICTANQLDTIPRPLLDRMETIRLSGYIAEEKLQIAKKHLWPKLIAGSGIAKSKLKMADSAIKAIIDGYAREAGVRHLNKLLAKIIRKSAVSLVNNKSKTISVNKGNLSDYLGMPIFSKESHLAGVGISKGLAWTSLGGVTLNIEAAKIHSSSRGFKLTGQLGNVMQESAQIAYSYIAANLEKYGAKINTFDKAYIHLHVPEGATPKDGPSAGITMASALLSLALNKRIKVRYAMTGEMTLTGSVLAVGGIREKVIAAKREGITNLILPEDVKSRYEKLPAYVTKGLSVNFVSHFDQVKELLFN